MNDRKPDCHMMNRHCSCPQKIDSQVVLPPRPLRNNPTHQLLKRSAEIRKEIDTLKKQLAAILGMQST
jgi:hypothetical protein